MKNPGHPAVWEDWRVSMVRTHCAYSVLSEIALANLMVLRLHRVGRNGQEPRHREGMSKMSVMVSTMGRARRMMPWGW